MISKLDTYFKNDKLMLELLTLKESSIASNIANIDTPNYKKINVNFLDEFKKKVKDLIYIKKNNSAVNSKKKNFIEIYKENLKQSISVDKTIDENFTFNEKNLHSNIQNSLFNDIKNSIENIDEKNNLLYQEITDSMLKNVIESNDSNLNITDDNDNSNEINLTHERISFVETELEHKKELAIIKYKIDNMLKVLD
ncbi:Flagellar basal body rod protein FlgB [Buchnera aphidicola (Anoecia corni)]|uniref:Flagellar basal body rod protein FlgB n=1 Tax=Buchnera aphidicola (Anoecia corni) TaxID=2994477 RepID=A0AAT9IGI6_9GAMM